MWLCFCLCFVGQFGLFFLIIQRPYTCFVCVFFLLLDWRKGGKQRKQSKQSRRYEWAGNFIIQMQKHIWIWMQVIMTDTKTDRQTGRPTDKQTYWQADRLTEWLTGRSSLRDCPSFVFQLYCPVWWIQIKWIYCCIHSVLPSFFRSMLPSPCLFPQRIHFLLLFSPHSFHFVCIKEKPLSAKTKEKPLSRAMRLVLRSSRFASPRLASAWLGFVLFCFMPFVTHFRLSFFAPHLSPHR